MEKDLHMSVEVAILGLSVYVLGFGLGPLVWAPLSEIYGRVRTHPYFLRLFDDSLTLSMTEARLSGYLYTFHTFPHWMRSGTELSNHDHMPVFRWCIWVRSSLT